MIRRRLIPAAVLFAALLPAAPAVAQVHVDPGSPSGKEYAIPLEQARNNASGNSGVGSGTNTSTSSEAAAAPLFGEGIDHKSNPPKGVGKRGQKSTTDGTAPATVGSAIAGTQPVRATVPSGGAKSTLTIGALALSVLLLGGVLGSIARRRQT
jgi:hypothetical protein